MHTKKETGFSLIEILVLIVVLSVGSVGIFALLNQVLFQSPNPVAVEQAVWIANAYMEEIVSKPFYDPTTGNMCPGAPASRALYDNVCDYQGLSESTTDQNGNVIDLLSDYRVDVSITPIDGWQNMPVTVLQIDVAVTHPLIPDLNVRAYKAPL